MEARDVSDGACGVLHVDGPFRLTRAGEGLKWIKGLDGTGLLLRERKIQILCQESDRAREVGATVRNSAHYPLFSAELAQNCPCCRFIDRQRRRK